MITLIGAAPLCGSSDWGPWNTLRADDPNALASCVRDAIAARPGMLHSAWVWLTDSPDNSLCLVDRIETETACAHPPIHFKSRLPRDTLYTSHAWLELYQSLVRLHQAELVVVLGMAPAGDVSTVRQRLEDLARALAPLVCAIPLAVPHNLVDALFDAQHATHSQRQQLTKLCQRYHALYRRWPEPVRYARGSPSETIATLENAIASAPTVYS